MTHLPLDFFRKIHRQIVQFFSPRRRKLQGAILVSFILAIVIVPNFAHAGVIQNTMNMIVTVEFWIANAIMKLAVVIIDIMVPVMTYNNFSNAQVVTSGWAIVRDVVNMFFVVVLIVIAFGTIFGNHRFQWQQQVPRLLIFAIVINFSKTLCGLMIDFGQVLMLTFANALRQIAAGNFVQLLGMGKMMSFGQNIGNGGEGVGSFDLFAAGLMAIFMAFIVVVTLLFMLVILVYRIVMLWVMIVMAPLAWFAGGAKGIIQTNAYATWWDKFKCLVAIGPVLAFFLWLTLAVLGAGLSASSLGFDTAATGGLSPSGNFITSIFELDNLIAFVIGIAMLFAGFDAAQQVCASMPFISKGIGKISGMGKGIMGKPVQMGKSGARFAAGGAVRMGARGVRLAGRGVKGVGRGVGRAAGAGLNSRTARGKKSLGLQHLTKKGRSNLWSAAADKAGKGKFGRLVAPALERGADAVGKKNRDAIVGAGKKYENASTGSKIKQLERLAGGASTAGGAMEAKALLREALGNKDMTSQLQKSGAMDTLWKTYGKDFKKDFEGDDATTNSIKAYEKANPHLATDAADKKDRLDDITSRDDVKGLRPDALADAAVAGRMENLQLEFGEGHNAQTMSAAEAISQGRFGEEMKNALAGFKEGDLRRSDPTDLVLEGTSEGSSGEQIVDYANLALSDGNFEGLDTLLSTLTQQAGSANGVEAFNANKMADVLRTQLSSAAADQSQGHGKAARAQQSLERLNALQDGSRAARATRDPSVSAFGEIPSFDGFSGREGSYVEENFAGSDEVRLQDGAVQTAGVISGLVGQIAAAQTDVEGGLTAELAGLTTDLASARQRIESEMNAEVTARQTALEKIKSKRREEEFMGSANPARLAELDGQAQAVEVEIKGLQDAIQGKVDAHEDVQKIQAEIEVKTGGEGVNGALKEMMEKVSKLEAEKLTAEGVKEQFERALHRRRNS